MALVVVGACGRLARRGGPVLNRRDGSPLVLAEHDFVLPAGEAAEFDTRLPHWFGSSGEHAIEILSILGRQGERMHVRAKPRAPRAQTDGAQR